MTLRAFAAAGALLLFLGAGASCSTSDSTAAAGTEGGAGDAGDASSPESFVGIQLDNDLCLGQREVVQTGADGKALCRIVLATVAGGCGQPGLQPATSADRTGIDAKSSALGSPPPADPLCVLAQSAPLPSGMGCADEQASSWCYVHGACTVDAGACTQSICTTDGFTAEKLVFTGGAWLACE